MFDFETIYNRLKEEFPNITPEMLENFIEDGHGDYIVKDGKRWFERGAFSNLKKIKGDYLRKLADPNYNDKENFELRAENCKIMKEKVLSNKKNGMAEAIPFCELREN